MWRTTCSSMKGTGRGGGVGARSGVCGDERIRRERVEEILSLKGSRLSATLIQCRQFRRNEFGDEDIEVGRA
jgi:hypothetical protein